MHVHAYFQDSRLQRLELKTAPDTSLYWHGTSDIKLIHPLKEWWDAYIAKTPLQQQPLPLDLSQLPPFTQSVLAELQNIPYGEWRSYADIAAALKNPQASRAVGSACGRNPFPLLIPCHRILASGARLGGFSCGLDLKRLLLLHEGISFSS